MTTTANPSSYTTAFDVLTALGTDRTTTTRLLGLLDTAGVDAVARLPQHTTPDSMFQWLPDLDAAALTDRTGLTGYEEFVQALQDVLADGIRSRRPTAAEAAEADAYVASQKTAVV